MSLQNRLNSSKTSSNTKRTMEDNLTLNCTDVKLCLSCMRETAVVSNPMEGVREAEAETLVVNEVEDSSNLTVEIETIPVLGEGVVADHKEVILEDRDLHPCSLETCLTNVKNKTSR